MSNSKVDIAYYSDILCVWAYVAQVRLEELKAKFQEQVEITPYHVTLFGDTYQRIAIGWKDRGGYQGFSDHILEVAEGFPHVEINPQVWKTCQPATSGEAHLFLKAIDLVEKNSGTKYSYSTHALVKKIEWDLRLAFFRDARDIAQMDVLFDISEQHSIPRKEIQHFLDNGQAMAKFCSEMSMKNSYKLDGSPTYLFNNKRQKLYGNVGYKILEANVSELLYNHDHQQASWC
ncbi:MAG: DsbA family protein [Enterobacterales bacterium]|nr:DsbA family protein [Enterobacterales bacterium]